MDWGYDISATRFEAIAYTWKEKIRLALAIPPEYGEEKENIWDEEKETTRRKQIIA